MTVSGRHGMTSSNVKVAVAFFATVNVLARSAGAGRKYPGGAVTSVTVYSPGSTLSTSM